VVPTGQLQVVAFHDANANSIWDSAELGVADVDIAYNGTDMGNMMEIGSLTTASSGTDSTNLPEGNYYWSSTIPAGYGILVPHAIYANTSITDNQTTTIFMPLVSTGSGSGSGSGPGSGSGSESGSGSGSESGSGSGSESGSGSGSESGSGSGSESGSGSGSESGSGSGSGSGSNNAPMANFGSFSVNEDDTLVGSVGATDVDGDALTYSMVSDAAYGSVAVAANGSFTYTPTANYNGPDSFTFKANDGTVDSNIATVSISVSPVNDAPVPHSAP